MSDHRIIIFEKARRLLKEGEISGREREELLFLLSDLLSALGKADLPESEGGLFLASNPGYCRVLLSLLKQQTAELDTLRKLSASLTANLDMSAVLNAITQEAMRLALDARAVHIFLYRNETLIFGAGLQPNGRTDAIAIPRQNGLTYAVARKGQTIIVENMRDHPLYRDAPPEWEGSIIGIPLKMRNRVVGVMNLSRSTTGGFSAAEVRLLALLSDQAAVAISNASLHQQVSRKAYTDTVTGLPNRRALDERLENEVAQADRTGQSFAVVMMDLDGFKSVNDTYGHALGDHTLRAFSKYIAQGVRSTDFLARYGGDELTLIMSQTALPAAMLVAEKIREKAGDFFFLAPNRSRITLGLSGGVAVYPTHGRGASELLRAADEALYRAKRHSRGQFLLAKDAPGSSSMPAQP
ncbi:MAG: GGDEF domain-containing protein [Anaerolineales bacterium]|nr:GGDEF domain-containing protein [Anaerolineales bacterium]MCZ2288742.1 sensor domain-containing diguanylate cyclase [Anaerolineales bacterium]